MLFYWVERICQRKGYANNSRTRPATVPIEGRSGLRPEHKDCNKRNMDAEEDSKESDMSLNLMNLPVEMIDNILSYLSYDQVSKLRAVSQKMNTICCHRLNNGFTQVEMFHSKCMKCVKSMLPRRESERKAHPLARHSDILISVETRLSMLSMTFTKYIESNQCCFFPGKVLDEAFKVLFKVATSLSEMEANRKPVKVVTHTLLPRPHEFLQEYRDISSMAMEYFDEKILPNIKEKMKLDNSQIYYYKFKPCSLRTAQRAVENTPTNSANSPPEPCSSAQRTPDCRLMKLLRVTNQNCKTTDRIVALMDKKIKTLSCKMRFQTSYMQRKLQNQRKIILSLQKELEETKSTMNVMRKDINLMKALPKDCSDALSMDQPGTSYPNLSISALSSISIPAHQHRIPTSPNQQKRIHQSEDNEEISTKKPKIESTTN